jgi:hypothetical protein
MEWLQNNWQTILEALGYLIGGATVIVGLINKPGANKAVEWLGKILRLLSAVTFKDQPGTWSVPLTNIDIKPAEPAE